MTITIPDDLTLKVEQRAKRFGYHSAEEYVLDFLKEDVEEHEPQVLIPSLSYRSREELETLLLEGLNSGKSVEADENFWKSLREKIHNGTLRRAGTKS
ncbi:MAG: hypothetical protein KF873_20485 [Gemmataceae bacterium]|nr:hypothetical protein [Gemmataceae bacterium]